MTMTPIQIWLPLLGTISTTANLDDLRSAFDAWRPGIDRVNVGPTLSSAAKGQPTGVAFAYGHAVERFDIATVWPDGRISCPTTPERFYDVNAADLFTAWVSHQDGGTRQVFTSRPAIRRVRVEMPKLVRRRHAIEWTEVAAETQGREIFPTPRPIRFTDLPRGAGREYAPPDVVVTETGGGGIFPVGDLSRLFLFGLTGEEAKQQLATAGFWHRLPGASRSDLSRMRERLPGVVSEVDGDLRRLWWDVACRSEQDTQAMEYAARVLRIEPEYDEVPKALAARDEVRKYLDTAITIPRAVGAVGLMRVMFEAYLDGKGRPRRCRRKGCGGVVVGARQKRYCDDPACARERNNEAARKYREGDASD